MEIYDSNGNLVVNLTNITNKDGQISYNYEELPFDDYTYNAYYHDGDNLVEKQGKLYTIVSGNGFSDIQKAINAASPGETIYLKNITYYNDIKDNMAIDKPITIIGVDGTVLDAEEYSRIFSINRNVNDVTLEHIEFINGKTNGGNGAAILVGSNSNNLNILDCEFKNNHVTGQSGYGGAIYIGENSNNAVIKNTTFENNSAVLGGGAIYNKLAYNNVIGNCTFINNSAYGGTDHYENGGGAVWSTESVMDITNSTFKENKAPYGGALRGAFNVYDSEFDNNTATDGNGGAIDVTCEESLRMTLTLEFRNSTFTNNEAKGKRSDDRAQGGAIHIYDIYEVDMYDCTCINNTADRGGAVDFYQMNITYVENCTFDNNNATSEGGGLAIFCDDSTFKDIDVSNNNAGTDGGAIWVIGDNSKFINVTSTNNTASRGGSSYVKGSNTLVVNSTFNNNSAISNGTGGSGRGGALDVVGDNCQFINVTSKNNNASLGGSTFVRGQNTLIENSTFNNNNATLRGGALDVWGDYCTVKNVTASNNTAKTDGGAIYIVGDYATFTQVESDNNTASRGGSTFVQGDHTTIYNCTLNNNKALYNGSALSGRGGGIDLAGNDCAIHDLNVSNNKADRDGGAFYVKSDDIHFYNIYSENNTAQRGGSSFIIGNNIKITNSTFNNNNAISNGTEGTGRGGAIDVLGDGCTLENVTSKYNNASLGGSTFIRGNNALINNCTLDNNNATLRGGGLNVMGDNCVVNDVDLSNNKAGSDGGAVYVKGDFATFTDVGSYNNTASRGGSTFVEGDFVDIHNCTLDNNRALYNGSAVSGRGGGIDLAGSNCTIYDLEVSNNKADRDGGAFYVKSDDIHFYDIVSVNNTAQRGGSSFIIGDNITVSNSVFNNNSAIYNGTEGTGRGGAIDVLGNGCSFENVTSINNNASLGGSSFIRGNNTVIKNCTLDNNNAALRGGALNVMGDNCTVTDVDLSNNKAGSDGGAVYVKGDHATFVDVYSVNNIASRGGSTFVEGDFVDIHNCTLDNNRALYNGSAVSGRGGGLDIAGSNCTIYDLEVSNNKADRDGGAFYVKSDDIHFYDIVSVNNTAQRGGSSFIIGDNITVSNSVFSNNSAIYNGTEGTGRGGAIDVLGNNCTFENVTSKYNNASLGGSSFIRGNNTVIKNCTLDNNNAALRGGGLNVMGNNCTVTDVDLSNNKAGSDGGAVYVKGDHATFVDVYSVNNIASRGGSTFVEGDFVDIHNCTLDNNRALYNGSAVSGRGGGLDIAGSNCTIYDLEVSNNKADRDGGAFYVKSDNIHFYNITSDNNTAQRGGSSFIIGDNITVSNSTFNNNKAIYNGTEGTGRGGAIDVLGNNCTFRNVTSVNNTAYLGGSSFIRGNFTTIENCTLDNNNAALRGGGLDIAGNNCTVINVDLSNNKAGTDGGALYIRGDNTLFDDVVSVNNTAQRGGSSFIEGNNITVQNCILDNNKAIANGTNMTTGRGGGLDVAGNNCTFTNISLSNNRADHDGGAVYVKGNNTVFDNVTSTNNTAQRGGSSFIEGNKIIVQNSKLDNNTASIRGGGLDVAGNNCTFYNVTLSNCNAAEEGGAIYIRGNYSTLEKITSVNNTAQRGGSSFIQGNNITVKNTNLNQNNASQRGGGLDVAGDNCTFINMTLSNCHSDEEGGAIYVRGNNTLFDNVISVNNTAQNGGSTYVVGVNTTIQNCNLDNNSASLNGGGLFVAGENCTVTNVSLSNNHAICDGGAIYVSGDKALFDNVTSVNNTAQRGGSTFIGGDNIIVQNCTLVNNSAIYNDTNPYAATGMGGAIYVDGNNGLFIRNNISYNNATMGGGVNIRGSNAKFLYNNITFNRAPSPITGPDTNVNSAGGGICVEGFNTNLTHNNISSNWAEDNGGGIFVAGFNTYLEDIYGFNNTAENGGFAKLLYSYFLTVKNSTFIKNRATGDIENDRGEGGAFHIHDSYFADIQANFYNNTATNGSAIYVQNSEVTIHDSRFFDNQARSYYLIASPENGTEYNRSDVKIVKIRHIGGDNIANAIHNRNGASDVKVNNITYPFYIDGQEIIKTTPNQDTTPVIGYENSENGKLVYLDDLENNQIIYYEVINKTSGKVLESGYAITDISGSINVDLTKYGVGNYTVKARYDETTYYTAINNETWIKVVDENNITVEKITLTPIVYVGNETQFVIIVNNTGSTELGNITVTELFNSTELKYLRLIDPTNKWIKETDYVFKYNGTLKANESIRFIVVFEALINGTIQNNITVSTNLTSNITANDTVRVYRPNMAVVKTSLNATVYVGDESYFLIVVKNIGDCDLGNVTVKDLFKELELEFVKFIDESGNWTNSTGYVFKYNLVLKVNQSVNFTVVFKTLVNGTIRNTVNATSDLTDNKTSNDTVRVYRPNMTVVKTALNTAVYVGDNASFMIVVTNTGDCDLANITVTELFNSTELKLIRYSGAGWINSSNIFTYNGILHAGESANFTVIFKTLVNGTIRNNVTVSSNVTSNIINNTTVKVYRPNMTVVKNSLNTTVYVGNETYFEIVVRNTGDCDLGNITVTELFNSNEMKLIKYYGNGWTKSGNIFNYNGVVKSGESVNFTVVFTTLVNGTITNTIVASSNVTENKTTNNNTTVENYICDLEITKEVNISEVFVNDNVEWTIVVVNHGPVIAHDVKVTETLPENIKVIKVTAETGMYDDSPNIWDIGDLDVNTPVKLIIITQILAEGNITNYVSVNSTTPESNESNNVANNTTFAKPVCDLEIIKLANATNINVTDNVEWTITVINHGPSIARDVVIRDILPEGAIIIGELSNNGKQNANEIIWEIGDLNVNASITIGFVTKITLEGKNTNIVTVNSTTLDSNKSNNVANNTTVANPICDLEITKLVNASSVFVNDSVRWTITVVNHGPSTAQNVIVKDIIPNGLLFNTPAECIFDGENLIWNVGSLDVNASKTLELITKVACEGNITNIAIVNSTTPETDESNNVANNTTVANPICDLEIIKLVNASIVYVNDEVEWTIIVFNKGPSSAADVVVNDNLPEGLKIISATPSVGSFNEETMIWEIGELNANSNVSLVLITKVLLSNTFMNIVTVNSTTPDCDESNNIANNTTEAIAVCDLEVTKYVNATDVNVGDIVQWIITVKNNGPNTAHDVIIYDNLPNGVKLVNVPENTKLDGNNVIWDIGDLNTNDSVSITLLTQVLTEGNITNVVSVNSSTPDSNKTNNIANNTTNVYPLCDLEIIKLVSDKKAYVGESLTWTIIVINHGPSTASNVKVLEDLPDSLKLTSYSSTKGSYDEKTHIWTIGTMENSSVETLTIVTKVLSVGNITNPVEVSSSTPDTNITNNRANNTTEVFNLVDLELKKSSDKKVYHIGDKMHWTIEVIDNGPGTAENVCVYDILPSGVKFISFKASKGQYDSNTGKWNIGDMENGEKVRLDIYCEVLINGIIVNNARVETTTNESDLSNNYDNATIKVIKNKTNPKPPLKPENHTGINKHVESKNPITMRSTGNPIAYIILAIFTILGCFWSQNRKE